MQQLTARIGRMSLVWIEVVDSARGFVSRVKDREGEGDRDREEGFSGDVLKTARVYRSEVSGIARALEPYYGKDPVLTRLLRELDGIIQRAQQLQLPRTRRTRITARKQIKN